MRKAERRGSWWRLHGWMPARVAPRFRSNQHSLMAQVSSRLFQLKQHGRIVFAILAWDNNGIVDWAEILDQRWLGPWPSTYVVRMPALFCFFFNLPPSSFSSPRWRSRNNKHKMTSWPDPVRILRFGCLTHWVPWHSPHVLERKYTKGWTTQFSPHQPSRGDQPGNTPGPQRWLGQGTCPY